LDHDLDDPPKLIKTTLIGAGISVLLGAEGLTF